MNKYLQIFALSFSLMSLYACGDDNTGIPEWPWEDPTVEEPTPEEPTDPETPEEPTNAKPRYAWIDAGGNFERYANSQENIKTDLEKVKNVGFTDIIVDVRPTIGDVLFESTTADKLTRIDIWSSNGYIWAERTATWDYLQTFIDEARALGLRVNASINTFVGGYLCPYGLGSEGVLFRDADKKGWASTIYDGSSVTNTMDMLDDGEDYGAKFFNPANDEAQEYIFRILEDLAHYDLDGIILDRCRYDDYGLQSDFSNESRTKFEAFIGQTVNNYPADIKTTWYPEWLTFRAKVIHDFIVAARDRVKAVNNKIRFGAYVGAWYSSYYESGVNWASPKFDSSTINTYKSWNCPSNYKEYGYADHLDFIFLGAYASSSRIYGSGEWSMEGFCKQGGELLMGDVPYAGGPDIGNATGWIDGDKAALIPDAIDACINNSDGFFVFDLCHVRSFDYWGAFKRGFDAYLKTVE